MQKIRRLLQGIRAMRDHNAAHIALREVMRAALSQARHRGEIHVFAIELRHLLAVQLIAT